MLSQTGGHGDGWMPSGFDLGQVYPGMPSQIVYITATNSAGAVGQAAFQLVPRRAIVSGSGTIVSPAGAYTANPALTGSASFGFNTSYERGGGTPAGPPVGQFA